MNKITNHIDLKPLKHLVKIEHKTAKKGDSVFVRIMKELQFYQMQFEAKNNELVEMRQELERTRVHFSALYDFSPQASFTFDVHGVILELNLAGAILLGKDRSSLLGVSFINFIEHNERNVFLNCIRACISAECKKVVEFGLDLPNGKHVRVQTTRAVAQSLSGDVDVCCMVVVGVSEHSVAEIKQRLTSTILENIQEGVMLADAQQRIVAVNPEFLKNTGFTREELIGFTPAILKSGRHEDKFYGEMYASLNSNDGWQGEVLNRRKSGEVCPEWVNIRVIRKNNGDVDCYVGIFSDIANQEAMKQRLRLLAYYDELTGLANRSLLYDRLQLALAHSKRSGGLLAVFFLDLDHFKDINDRHGHSAGDFVIKKTAERLSYCMREGDTLCRLGGDEFVALLPDIGDMEASSLIASRIVKSFEKPLFFDDIELHISASIGISISPEDGDELTDLLKNADTAMYRVKRMGGGRYQYFSAPVNR